MDKIVTDKKILQTVSRDIEAEELIALDVIKRMQNLLQATSGVGIAAIQIGLPFRVCLIRWAGMEHVIVNPFNIEKTGGTKKKTEGCLSLPGYEKKVTRAKTVRFESYDPTQVKFTSVGFFGGMTGRIIQHEFDHFEGKLIDG